MINWNNIQTVLLDMDGTLLDLHFDNHFWREHVPLRFAQKHEIDTETAKQKLFPMFQKVEGTMDWYCVDYWSKELDMDIAELKAEVNHLIAIHPYVLEFLEQVRLSGKRMLLVTDAHMKSLNLKMQHTQLQGHFDRLVCTHDYGIPKANIKFWQRFNSDEKFDPETTLFIDDNLAILSTAHQYGIKHLRAIYQPDSQQAKRDITEFEALHSFEELLPVS